MALNVVLETDQFVVVDKPAGIQVEHFQGVESLEDMVRDYLKKPFVGIVHRLDRPVSGLVILAKKKSALKKLNEQFRERKIEKGYFAVTNTSPVGGQGKLEHYLKRSVDNRSAVVTSQKDSKGVYCALEYRMIEERDGLYLLEVKPLTGRFHQIRVQLAAVGCPIVGDVLYGGKEVDDMIGIGLRAFRLVFYDPVNGQKIEVRAPWKKENIWKRFLGDYERI
jgi:23S rRNA pseudouridine1911/1915/1917 synthase